MELEDSIQFGQIKPTRSGGRGGDEARRDKTRRGVAWRGVAIRCSKQPRLHGNGAIGQAVRRAGGQIFDFKVKRAREDQKITRLMCLFPLC